MVTVRDNFEYPAPLATDVIHDNFAEFAEMPQPEVLAALRFPIPTDLRWHQAKSAPVVGQLTVGQCPLPLLQNLTRGLWVPLRQWPVQTHWN